MTIVQKKDKIVWLDDEPDSISKHASMIEERLGLEMQVTPKPVKALELIRDDGFHIIFIVDLLLKKMEETGLGTAKVARNMLPLLPIVAVTEHLPQFREPMMTSLVEETYPFESIWEKEDLRHPDNIEKFLDRISLLFAREVHLGSILRMESDFTEVRLKTPTGNIYERFFETDFLLNSGIIGPKDNMAILFSKSARQTYGQVTLQIIRLPESIINIEETIESPDFRAIRDKFASAINDTNK